MDQSVNNSTDPLEQNFEGSGFVLQGFRLAPEFDPLRATYRDKAIEKEYQKHLIQEVLGRERTLSYNFVLIYFLFGFLDILVIDEQLPLVLTLRWLIFSPLFLGVVALTHIDRFKPKFPYIYTLAIFIAASSIVWMIGLLPAENPPPYMVGIIVVFIFAACILHLPFLAAAAAYVTTTALYSVTMLLIGDFERSDIIAGHFFMVSSALLAIGTTYVQEIRARVLWRQQMLREKHEEQINQLLIEATAADQSKINFLSMMSHELRTPLHQIIGFSEIVGHNLSGSSGDSENTDHLSQIQSSAQMLLSRIQKMLRYADATAGKIEYDRTTTSVREIVEASLEQMCTSFEKLGIRTDLAELEEAKINVDLFHTCYAINNILENALNASTVNGRLWISGKLNPDNGYELIIRDEGSGMSPEQLRNALKPFTQTEKALNRSHEGVGLGLTLANKIFEGQDATLNIQSKMNVGTTITITFANPKPAVGGKKSNVT